MTVTIRYICDGCGWVWTRPVAIRVKLAATFPQPAPRIGVPADRSPCCGENTEEATEDGR